MTRRVLLCLLAACVDQPEDASLSQDVIQRVQKIWLEAESGTLGSPMQLGASATASAGKDIVSSAGSGGSATYSLDVYQDATFFVWARVVAPSTSANRISLRIDGAGPVFWDLPVTTTWAWVRLPSQSYSLTAGTHTLELVAQEAGVSVDRLLFTSSNAFTPIVRTLEAESASLVAPMQVGSSGSLLDRTSYIWVPNGAGTNGAAHLASSLPADFNDFCVLWGRFNAPTSADNSFVVEGTPWELPLTTSWEWNRLGGSVPLYFLLDSTSVLDVTQGDDGTRLDKLVITNDVGFTLVEPPELVKTL